MLPGVAWHLEMHEHEHEHERRGVCMRACTERGRRADRETDDDNCECRDGHSGTRGRMSRAATEWPELAGGDARCLGAHRPERPGCHARA